MKQPNMAEVKTLMDKYELTEEQAIQLWLEDNDELENEEIEEMTKKAKANKVGAKADSKKHTNSKPKTHKNCDEKIQIYNDILAFLNEKYNVTVLKNEKLLEIELNGLFFKLDLIDQLKKNKPIRAEREKSGK